MYIIYPDKRTVVYFSGQAKYGRLVAMALALCWPISVTPLVAHSQVQMSPANGGLINPQAAVFNSATGKVYVVDAERGVVNVSDDAANSTVAVKVGAGPVSIAVNTLNGRAYVANAAEGTVSILDGRTDQVIATVAVGSHPYSIAANSVTGKVYVSHTFSDQLTIIDDATGRVTSIKAGSFDLIAVNSRTNTIYLLGYEGGNLAVMDGGSNAITERSVGMHAWGLVADEKEGTVYVGKTGNAEIAVPGAASELPAKIPVGSIPGAVAFNPRTSTLYAANYGEDSVTVIDGEKRIPTGTIPVGSRPEAIAVDPASGLVFVANTHDNTVTVIDGATKKVCATVTAGKNPYALAYNPKAGKLHIANLDDASFTIIDMQRMIGGAR